MTTLAAWVSVDSEKVSACYLMSDSRINWPNAHWDAGQKLFVSAKFPDIFGYSGDVQFPTLALRQVLDRMDQGLLFAADADSALRHRSICTELETAYRGYPAHGPNRSVILHFSREGAGRHAKFSLWKLAWSRDFALQSTALSLPTASVIGETAGSGWKILIDRSEAWKKAQGRTARGVFSSFCDALESGEDPVQPDRLNLWAYIRIFRAACLASFGAAAGIWRARSFPITRSSTGLNGATVSSSASTRIRFND
jgi:hypothetical protein